MPCPVYRDHQLQERVSATRRCLFCAYNKGWDPTKGSRGNWALGQHSDRLGFWFKQRFSLLTGHHHSFILPCGEVNATSVMSQLFPWQQVYDFNVKSNGRRSSGTWRKALIQIRNIWHNNREEKWPRRYIAFIVIRVCGFFLSFQQHVFLPSHVLIATLPLAFL